jgi:hypothetical protein
MTVTFASRVSILVTALAAIALSWQVPLTLLTA